MFYNGADWISNKRVSIAQLQDILYFNKQDLKKKITAFLSSLSRITFRIDKNGCSPKVGLEVSSIILYLSEPKLYWQLLKKNQVLR
jgi:hypothetical protein